KRCMFIRLGFAHNSFAQNIHGEADFLRPPLAQCRYDVIPISSGNELTSHFGNIPPQDRSADPGHEAGRLNTHANEWRKSIFIIAEIFFEMLNNLAGPSQ